LIALVNIDDEDSELAKRQIAWLLEGVVRTNQLYLIENAVPPLYESGVFYRPEPWAASAQSFSEVAEVRLRRWGECKALSCWLVAEKRNAARSAAEAGLFTLDIQARDYRPGQRLPRGYENLPRRRGRQRLWHVRVKLPGGGFEDPSERVPKWQEL
jgi:hypothetical protein